MTPRRDDPKPPVIDTPKIRAEVAITGYVSGIRAGTFLDKTTGARDLGFGLDVVDFLLEPADPAAAIPKDQYDFGPMNAHHGNIPKRYVEGPQICTQAKRIAPIVGRGPDFTVVTLRHDWSVPYAPHNTSGSRWEQTLIFPDNERFLLACDRVTSASASDNLSFRVDLPGHIRHERGDRFEHVYLSYGRPTIIPSTEFVADFPPDAKFLYTKGVDPLPDRFIRAYQVDLGPGKPDGPWLAGMTLEASDVSQAWCHQRGYVCLIEELGGRPIKVGETFGAAYVIGWFDDLDAMHATYDRFKGFSGLRVEGSPAAPTGYRGLRRDELKAVGGPA